MTVHRGDAHPETVRNQGSRVQLPGVTVQCPQGVNCDDSHVALNAILPGRGAQDGRKVTLAKTYFTVKPGESGQPTVRLSPQGMRILRKYKKLTVTATIVVRDSATGQQATRDVQLTLTYKKSKKR